MTVEWYKSQFLCWKETHKFHVLAQFAFYAFVSILFLHTLVFYISLFVSLKVCGKVNFSMFPLHEKILRVRLGLWISVAFNENMSPQFQQRSLKKYLETCWEFDFSCFLLETLISAVFSLMKRYLEKDWDFEVSSSYIEIFIFSGENIWKRLRL